MQVCSLDYLAQDRVLNMIMNLQSFIHGGKFLDQLSDYSFSKTLFLELFTDFHHVFQMIGLTVPTDETNQPQHTFFLQVKIAVYPAYGHIRMHFAI